jgi:hypothetical protein
VSLGVLDAALQLLGPRALRKRGRRRRHIRQDVQPRPPLAQLAQSSGHGWRVVYDPTDAKGRRYAAWVRALRGARGVYAIREIGGGQWLYVGSDWRGPSGRLYATLTRHFQRWTDSARAAWYHAHGGDGVGPVYSKFDVEVRVWRTKDGAAAARLERQLIRRERPLDNHEVLEAPPVPGDVVPF